jgi:hypothetical protein
MNTITQEEAFINYLTTIFVKEHFTNSTFISQENALKMSTGLLIQAYANYLEHIDEVYFKSPERKRSFKVKQKITRTVETIFGSVKFIRRQYQSIANNSYFYYVDNHILNLLPYQRLSNELIANILEKVVTDSYQRIANDYKISRTTVYNKVKSFSDCLNETVPLNEIKKVNTLYIQADEIVVPLQNIDNKEEKEYNKDYKSNNKHGKLNVKAKPKKAYLFNVCIHEGLETVCKGRNTLINKILLSRGIDETTEQFNDRIYQTIVNNYDYENIHYYGDGATWIKKSAEDLGATYILDLFHAHQAITRVVSADKKSINKLIKLCQDGKKKEFFDLIKENNDISKFGDYKMRSYKYLINNWKHIQKNYTLPNNVGCSMEGINYHHFSTRLTTKPKGFSAHNARVIAQLICLKNNNKNFKSNLLKQIEETSKSKKQKDYKAINKYDPRTGNVILSTTEKVFNSISTGANYC